MKQITKPAALAASVLLASCATMFNGSSQMISVRSNINDTKLYANEAYIGKDSGITTFQKKENYVLTARKDGCSDTSVVVSKSFDAITLLGVLLDWGVVSVLIVDGAATGAWQKFDQTSYVVDPVCNA